MLLFVRSPWDSVENPQWQFNASTITFGLYSNDILPKQEYFPVVVQNYCLRFSGYLWSRKWIQNFQLIPKSIFLYSRSGIQVGFGFVIFSPILREMLSFSGVSQHLRVLFCLSVRCRASRLSSATVNREIRRSTSGPTAGSWFALVGITRPLPCVTPHLTPVNLKVASPNQKASAVWTIGSLSISHKHKSPARKVRASRSRRRSRGISVQEMVLMVGLWAGARSHWDLPLAKATNVRSLSLAPQQVFLPPPSAKRSQNGSAGGCPCLRWACVWIKERGSV